MVVQESVTGMGVASLDAAAIQGLRASHSGEVLTPADAGYAAARQVFNAMIDKRPALIARCAGVADVIAAVNFARERDFLVAVRGGGHNVAGKSMCDGGLVIDLSRMKSIRVDPVARTARAEGGATYADFDRETQAFGLATTGGTVSMTGIAGLTLGGGVGWLMRQHGTASDNLLSVDLVTADGSFLTASETAHPDLFWGIRGAGANFGVVTAFEYRLHPVGQVTAGMLIHPIERAREVYRLARDTMRDAPPEMSLLAGLLYTPEGQPAAALLPFYNGTGEAAERALAPIRRFGPPLADHVQPMAYRQLQTMLDASFPVGLHNYWKSHFLRDLPDAAIDAIAAHFAQAPSHHCLTVLEEFGGDVTARDPDATAFNLREGRHNVLIVARWADPTQAEGHIAWARASAAAVEPFATAAEYVNYMNESEQERVKEVYGATKYARLAAIKRRYDPTNFFRVNHNIVPAGSN